MQEPVVDTPLDVLDILPPPPDIEQPEDAPEGDDELDTSAADDLQFDEDFRLELDGLMHIGFLRKDFSWLGHKFQIKTLTIDEMLEVGLMVKKYDGSIGAQRAYVTAVAAAAVERVDGRPTVTPVGPKDDLLEMKFRYAREYWFSWTVDRIYSEVMALEARVAKIIEQLGESSG